MPTTTTDQGISRPVDADSADNPVAFVNELAGVEPRLVRLYTNEADRTAKMLLLAEGNVSYLQSEDRADLYTGSVHVSLYSRSLYAYKFRTADSAALSSNNTLQPDTDLVATLPTTGRFFFDATIFYDSSTTANFKVGFTIPAAATMRWGGIGGFTSLTAGVGTANFSVGTASGFAIAYGGSGTGTANTLILKIEGFVLMGGTGGSLQFQWAQNTSNASNTVVRAGSQMRVWRVA